MRLFGFDITRAEPRMFRPAHFAGMSLEERVCEAVHTIEDLCPGDPASTKTAIMAHLEKIIDGTLAERAKR